MDDLIKWIFSSTVKCVGKHGGEWVNVEKANTIIDAYFLHYPKTPNTYR